MPGHLAPDGPTQGARATMRKLSLSALMGCGTRLASDICFEYPQTVPEEKSPFLSLLLGAKSRQHLRKKAKITAIVPAPKPPNPSKQYAFLLGLPRTLALLGGTEYLALCLTHDLPSGI